MGYTILEVKFLDQAKVLQLRALLGLRYEIHSIESLLFLSNYIGGPKGIEYRPRVGRRAGQGSRTKFLGSWEASFYPPQEETCRKK